MGARPWAARAHRELIASGERTTPQDPASGRVDAELTPQELRVALEVARGLSNAQVGGALFLSVKTVEFHLGKVYRKLGVRSRGGLAQALGSSWPAGHRRLSATAYGRPDAEGRPRVLPTTLTISLPDWVNDVDRPDVQAHLTDRMEFVLDLAVRNVDRGTGGPFAAAVFEQGSGRLVSVGVNRVVPENRAWLTRRCSRSGWRRHPWGPTTSGALDSHDSSWSAAARCARCAWVRSCGPGWARSCTPRRPGMSSRQWGSTRGRRRPDYSHQLAHRGIRVVPGVMRDQGLAVLRRYVAAGGVVYNAHH